MKTLFTVEEVTALIEQGQVLLLAGDESLLSRLPKGPWIGGTIPYFMSTEDGGVVDRGRLFATRLPDSCSVHAQGLYEPSALPRFAENGPDNGFTLILLPAFSQSHALFAENVADWSDAFARPVAGWVAGIHLDDAGRVQPKVFDGRTGVATSEGAVVMHVALPTGLHASIDILNLFGQGDGDTIEFETGGFSAGEALINGERRNLARYIADSGIDTKLPLVASYNGAMINVSLQQVDAEAGQVAFYAPVFAGVAYRFAGPVADYAAAFEKEIARRGATPDFACNCILNFLYAGLEGRRTGEITGPMTFGEIAYMLLNQTMVYLTIERD